MKRLKKIYVEITNECNLACPFCPPNARASRSMTESEFTRVLAGIDGAAALLYFHVKGEPLLHPLVGKFLDLANANGFSVNITTNGTLLGSRIPDLGGKPGLARVNISLHSLAGFPQTARTEALRGTLESAERLVALNRESRPGFLVSYRLWTADDETNTATTIAEIARFYGIAPELIREKLAGSDGFRIHENAAIHTAETFRWPSLDGEDFGERGFCYGLRDQAAILADGTVVPCCLDGDGATPLGNIFEDNLEDILGSPRARALYDSFTDRKIREPLCRRCGYRARFNR
jgi:radical SAM protein with 4Fe4S-binding SPASM domain